MVVEMEKNIMLAGIWFCGTLVYQVSVYRLQ